MSEGLTCYEQDEELCSDEMCLRTGCRLRNDRLRTKQQMPARIALSEQYVDERLERILRAAGSSLRHYMPGSKEELRRTMRQLLEEASTQDMEARHD